MKKINKGFTLIELSIVIVIIGLIVAAIISGSTLIESSKNSATINDFKRFETYVINFKAKYNYYPGDIPNATNYFPSCTDSGNNNCNGDGNNYIAAVTNSKYEHLRAWEHLTLSGIIEGNYAGIDSIGNSNQITPGVNAPYSRFNENGCYFIANAYWSGKPDHLIAIILGKSLTNFGCIHGHVPAVIAKSIDKKIDDGVANKGSVQGLGGFGQTDTCRSSGEYIVSNDGENCRMAYGIINR